MDFKHTPVLFNECIEALNIKSDGIYVDGTLGGGGHSRGIGERLSKNGTLIGIDRDMDAIRGSEEKLRDLTCKVIKVKNNYGEIKQILSELNVEGIDGALLDLGVSSHQLDESERGFSYMQDSPLDMRMDREQDFTAKDVVNDYSKDRLTKIIREYGEERFASRIVSFIVEARKKGSIETTGQLVEIIKAAVPAAARRDGPHPAKRTFQAIRIEVNDELSVLQNAVEDFCDVLKPGGRMAVISFHSLEDRIVKEVFARRENPCTCPKDIPICICGKKPDMKRITRKPIIPGDEEESENPRARSAKLRVAEKL